MPINYAQLKTELNTDPTALGYSPLVAAGNDEGLAKMLNEVRAGISITKSYVPMEDALAAIVKTEFDALTAANKTVVDQFLRGDRIRTGDANMRTTLAALFAAGTTSRTNLIALATRTGSRAEQLFGEGATVTNADIAQALRAT